MAYMNQQRKKELTPGIKKVLNKYGVKGTLRCDYGTLVCTLREGGIDFVNSVSKRTDGWGNPVTFHYQVNEYHIDSQWEGVAKDFLLELAAAMRVGNWDHSDPMTDYFNVGWYITINIGEYSKPYLFNPLLTKAVA